MPYVAGRPARVVRRGRPHDPDRSGNQGQSPAAVGRTNPRCLRRQGNAFDAFIDSTQQYVTGEVRLRLEPGRCFVVGRRSPHSLYDYGLATYDAADRIEGQAANQAADRGARDRTGGLVRWTSAIVDAGRRDSEGRDQGDGRHGLACRARSIDGNHSVHRAHLFLYSRTFTLLQSAALRPRASSSASA